MANSTATIRPLGAELHKAVDRGIERDVQNGLALMRRTDDLINGVDIYREISSIKDSESAKRCVDHLEKLKKLLEVAEQYEQYAAQYLVAECKMWLAIADTKQYGCVDWLSFERSLKPRQIKLIVWLRNMDERQRALVIDECSKGKSVERQRQDAVAAQNWRSRTEAYNDTSDAIVERCKRTGKTICSMEGFYFEWRGHGNASIDPKLAKACVEKTRDKLLRMGAIGLGDGSGTYVLASHMKSTDVKQAVETRLQSIKADISSLRDLCDTYGITLPRGEVLEIRAAIMALLSSIEASDVA